MHPATLFETETGVLSLKILRREIPSNSAFVKTSIRIGYLDSDRNSGILRSNSLLSPACK